MATYKPITKKFTYSQADERLIDNARRLFSAMAEYGTDSDAKRDATSAFNAAQHCLAHIQKQRAK